MAEQQQTKVDSDAIKSDAADNHQEAKESSNMRSILAEIGITGAVVQDVPPAKPPKFRYTRDELIALSKTRLSTTLPAFLDARFLNNNGFWDPEKWAQAERSGTSAQPADEPKAKREKPADLDKDAVMGKRRAAGQKDMKITKSGETIYTKKTDTKERLKEEQDGIVLGPQRRSFGTGCHVIQQQGAGRTSESPTDNRINERDAHRETNRRIGSGRFIPRERDRDRDREFGYRSGDRRDRDHYDRDDRDTTRDPRDGRMMRERSAKERDGERRGGRGFRRIEEEEEPEWFSGGPTSQNETIELRGFDEVQDEGRNHEKGDREGNKRECRRSWRQQKTPTVEDVVEKVEEEKDRKEAPTSRPSSASDQSKTKEKRSGKKPHRGKRKDGREKADSSATTSNFDFEDLFTLDTIPGIFSPTAPIHESGHGLSGSRFGQFFQRESSPIHNLSSETSRRSSFQDEFTNLSSSQNANIKTSPTNGSEAYFTPINPAKPMQSNNNAAKSLLEIINGNNDNDDARFEKNNSKNAHMKQLAMSGKVTSVQELEAGLKNLVMGNQSGASGLAQDNASIHFSNANGQNHDNMNAFNQLLTHISDGHVTPLSTKGLSCTSLAKSKVPMLQEKDTFKQGSGFVQQQQQVNAHLMNILKHAPTEQDILAGLVKGHPLPPSVHVSGTSSDQVKDTLNLLVSSSQASSLTQSSSTRNANLQNNPLAKILNLQQPTSMQSGSSYNYESSEKHGSQIGRQQQNLAQTQQQVAHSAVPPANSIQQQQREILAAILKQQQQQQQQVGQPRQPSPVHHPLIQQTVSPPKMMQAVIGNGPVSPRSQSPRHSDALQQVILQQQQQQQRARIPSPLVFGQTPPVITHAPSPIHPGQMAQSIGPTTSSMNPNTLQVHGPHVMTRVPSPQELRAHTQQIMQNALIKKKLEEQKENYRKRQEMQGARSPNPTKYGEPTPSKSTTGMSPTLIPTSVMRKMQAGKDKDLVKGLQLQQQPSQMLQPQPIGGVLHIDGGIDKMHQTNVPRQLHGQAFINGQVPIRTSQVPVQSGMPSQLPLQGRRIIKSNQNLCNQGHRVAPQPQLMGNQPKSFLSTSGNLDIAKQLMMQQQQAVAQRQLNVSPLSPSSIGQTGIPIRGANPMHSSSMNAVRSGINMAPNNYMLRNMGHQGQAAAFSQLNQLAMLQQQQRGVDPRQLQLPSHLHPVTMQQLLMGVQNNSQRNIPMSAGGHPTGSHQPGGSIIGKSADPLFALSSSAGYPSVNTSFNNLLKNVGGAGMGSSNGTAMSSGRHSPMGNLDKWFGKDLKQNMPNLPPVPTQRAQYVEEVEQRQQATVQN